MLEEAQAIPYAIDNGGWVSASAIFRNLPAGATIHSRISELRKTWGYEIEHETRGPGARGSFYRLVLPEKAEPPVYVEDFAPSGDFPIGETA